MFAEKRFCVWIHNNQDGTRDLVVRQVDDGEILNEHMKLDEVESFVTCEPTFTAIEKMNLLSQLDKLRQTEQPAYN